MTGIDPAKFLEALPIGNYDAPPEGGFIGGVKDIALRAPVSGLAMASQDLARPVDFIAESFGGDFTDDRDLQGDLLDDNWNRSSDNATVGAVADFTAEATRFLAEDLLFRGALRAGTTSAISKVGSVGATEAAALAKNSSVLKNLATLAGGAKTLKVAKDVTLNTSRGIEAIKLGETALSYAGIGAVQAPANMGAGESIAGYAARDVGMNLVFDTAFGLAGKGISKVSSKYVMPYLRSTKIGNAIDTAAVVSQMGDSASRMVDLMSLNDAQLRSLSDEGRLSKDLAERLIQTKYEPNAPEYSLDGPARSRVYNEMISAGVKEDVANAALAVNDAFAQMATRVGDDVTIDGKVVSKIKSVDDWYDRQNWRSKAVESEVQGQVKFSDSGKSLITLFSTSNASTVFHESSHIFRRYLPNLSPELSAQANKFVKSAGDVWNREQEELWATSFEKYLLTGEPPTKKMESVFASTKAWMLDVYRNVVGGVNDINLDPSLKNVFDQMLGGLNVPGPIDTLNQTFKQALKDAAKNGASPVQALQQAVHGTFNLNHIKTTSDVRKVFEGMADEVLTHVNKLKGDKQTHAEWLKYAEKVGVKDLLQTLDSTGKGMNNIAAQVVGGKMLAARIGVSVAELGQRLLSLETAGKLGAEFTATKVQFADARQGMARILTMVNALQRESARAVNAGNVDIKITQSLKEVDLKAATDFFSDIEAKVDDFEKAFDEYANPPKPEPTPKGQESGGKSPNANDPTNGPTMPQDRSVPEGTLDTPKGPQKPLGASNAKPETSPKSPAGATVAKPEITPGLTPNERVFISNILDAMNAEQFDAVTQVFDLRDAKAIDAVMELWVANLLSGMKTQSVNVLGNVINTVSQPLMKAIGEAVSLRGREAVRSLGMYHQLGMAMRDMVHLSRLKGPDGAGFQSVWKALKYETSIFDRNVEGLSKPSFTAKTFGVKNKAGATAINAVGTAARAPGLRVLGAVDEVFQNLNYIAHIRSDAIKQAQNLVEQGLMRADQIEGHVAAHVKNAFRKGGANVAAPIYASAYKYAKDVGFKTPLGRFGESIAKLKRDHPLLGFIIPFVRVPLNITKTAVRMTPGVGFLEYAAEAAGERLTRDQLSRRRGEVIAGIGVWGAAAYAYSQGLITGGGPQNPDEKKLWMAAGNQPYSFVVHGDDGKKRYISYARAEPFSSSLGIVADAFEAMPYMDAGEADKAAVLIVQSFVKNSISKTYLKGVNEFTRAMSDVNYIPSWARNTLASGVVPASVAQFALSDDDGLREVYSMTEAIQRRVPGLSKELPPRRNVLGEVTTPPGGWLPFVGAESQLNHTLGARMLSPAALSEQSSDPVINELASLRHGITMPPKKIENIDLTGIKTEKGQQAYDRWLELTGTIAPGGRTLHQALETLISSKSYQQLPPASISDPFDNPRMKAVGRVMSRYREAAKQQLYKEVPELRDQIQENLRARASRMRSGIDAAITWAGQ